MYNEIISGENLTMTMEMDIINLNISQLVPLWVIIYII